MIKLSRPIHEAMREARLRSGISQGKLADMAGMYQSSICNYESGRTVPSLFSCIELASQLGISLEQYIGLRPLPEDWGQGQ